jgi:hypothetical protein
MRYAARGRPFTMLALLLWSPLRGTCRGGGDAAPPAVFVGGRANDHILIEATA